MRRSLRIFLFVVSSALFAGVADAQRIAVLTPDNADTSREFAGRLETTLAGKVKLLDDGMARAAFEAAGFANGFNLSLDEAKRAGQSMGCDFFVLARSAVQRRSSFERPEYYEGYATIFLVSTRTGRLALWKNEKHEADTPQKASAGLDRSISLIASQIERQAKQILTVELNEQPPPHIDEPPDEASAAAKNFKAPIPYRRLKPEYTSLASLYDVTATVDITIDLDAAGKIMRTEITRWAGYDLDEAVDTAVRSMNWRPAERDSKFIPMRFLVRYNFKKPEKPRP